VWWKVRSDARQTAQVDADGSRVHGDAIVRSKYSKGWLIWQAHLTVEGGGESGLGQKRRERC